MKKIFVVAITVSMAVGACGKKKPAADPKASTGSAAAPAAGSAAAGSDAPAAGY